MANSLLARLDRRLSAALNTKTVRIRPERPVVSFTFDDAPLTAATTGARILEDAGACGTFYVATGLCGLDEASGPILAESDLARLNDRGHELACHTFSHRRVSTLSASEFADEARRNQAFVSGVCGDVRLSNFSFPFGDVSMARKSQAQGMFATCRGISPGVNRGNVDFGLLKAVSIYADRRTTADIDAYLDSAAARPGWLIFYTHDVVESRPSPWGCTAEQLQHAVSSAFDRGFEILTVRNAIGRLATS